MLGCEQLPNISMYAIICFFFSGRGGGLVGLELDPDIDVVAVDVVIAAVLVVVNESAGTLSYCEGCLSRRDLCLTGNAGGEDADEDDTDTVVWLLFC